MRIGMLLIGFAVCLSGCATLSQPSVRETANRLVSVMVSSEDRFKRSEDRFKRSAAVKQLRQMALAYPLDIEILTPLIDSEYAVSEEDAADACRILATGGPRIDELVWELFRKDGGGAIVLALAAQPMPQVTQALVKMADSERESEARRRLCRLILAARGEKSRDWMALVLADVRAEPIGYGEEYRAYEYFLGDLGHVVGKLPRTPALSEALFQRVRHYNTKPTEGAAVDALISLAACGADVRSVVNSQQFKDWLAEQPGDGKPGGFMAHMVRACLGIETKVEMEKALAQLGAYGVFSDKVPYCFAFFAPWLTGKDVRAAIHQGLSSSNESVRRGALCMLFALGPDAREMLPEIEKSLFDHNADFRNYAREMFKYVAGLDATGEWCAETVPEYKELIQQSLKLSADSAATP